MRVKRLKLMGSKLSRGKKINSFVDEDDSSSGLFRRIAAEQHDQSQQPIQPAARPAEWVIIREVGSRFRVNNLGQKMSRTKAEDRHE